MKPKKIKLPRRIRRKNPYYPRPLEFKVEDGKISVSSKRHPEQHVAGYILEGTKTVLIEDARAFPDRQGIGTNMVKYFLAKCRQNGIEKFRVNALYEAFGFWQKMGFTKTIKETRDGWLLELDSGSGK